MASIRQRLTLAYATALAGTMLAFALGLWVTRRASMYRELEQHVRAEAEVALRAIRSAREAGDTLTTMRDTAVGPAVTPSLRNVLEGVPDYVLLLDPSGRLLYPSFAVRQLDGDDQATLQSAALDAPLNGSAVFVNLNRDRLLIVARSEPDMGPTIDRVVAGSSTRAAEFAPRELVGTMVVVMPLIFLLSLGLAYLIAGRAFRPVDRLINEVEAITDGRSLHRRLPVGGNDELTRLTTTLNDMMSRLEDSFGALRRFTADASHELKTPLTVLRADVERAMHSRPHSSEQLIALEEALHETTRMADLVDSLLTLARADEGRFDLHREPVALEPLVREVFETAVILGEDAGLSVYLPVVEEAIVLADRPRLRQLFLNLVTNAIKYTPRGGRVELSLSRRNGTVTFSVRDSGIGIAAADLPHIFERFWRADRVRSRTAERGGFGLGLAISQYIAQAHGGSLTVQSRLGRGSTFTVTLPLPTQDDVADEPAVDTPVEDEAGAA